MARFTDDHVIALPLPAPVLPPRPATRLSLTPGPVGRGALDGGWWPRSRDAEAELAELVTALELPPGATVRLGVDLNDWDRVPRRMVVEGRLMKVGWLPNLDHMVTITCDRLDEVMLLVVPPEAAGNSARTALAMAAAGIDSVRPQEILAGCDISTERAGTMDDAPEGRVHTMISMRPAEEPARIGRWLHDSAPTGPAD